MRPVALFEKVFSRSTSEHRVFISDATYGGDDPTGCNSYAAPVLLPLQCTCTPALQPGDGACKTCGAFYVGSADLWKWARRHTDLETKRVPAAAVSGKKPTFEIILEKADSPPRSRR
jgi:hypothetical protein